MTFTKIQRVSHCFRIFFQVCFLLAILIPLLQWFLLGPILQLAANTHGKVNLIPIPPNIPILHPLTWVDQLIGFATSLLPMSVHLAIIYQLVRLFKLYEQNRILTHENAMRIRKISYFILLGQLIVPAHQMLLSFALTLLNTNGARAIAVSFGAANISIILIGLLILLVSWIMTEGARLDEENKQFI